GDAQFFLVMPKLMYAITIGIEDLRDQQPEFAIAQHRDLRAARNVHLIQNLARRRQRLDEHSAFGRDGIRKNMQIALRQGEKFAKRPRVLDDAEDSTLRAVAAEALAAPGTRSTAKVDLAHYPPADQIAP